MVSQLEDALGREAEKIFRPMQPGDVRSTYAEIGKIAAVTGYAPKVMLPEGLARFVEWYRGFYG